MSEYWPMIPPSVIRDQSLSALSVRVYAALAAYADHATGECFPGEKTIATDIGVSDRCVRDHIAILIDAGHIEKQRRRLANAVLTLKRQGRNADAGQEINTGTAAHQDRNAGAVKTGTAAHHTIKQTKETNHGTKRPAAPASPAFDVLIEKWNAIEGVAHCRKPTDDRLQAYRARSIDDDWREHVDDALHKVARSSFCRGQNDRGWRADIDWLLKPDTITKILEGKYDDRNGNESAGPQYATLEALR